MKSSSPIHEPAFRFFLLTELLLLLSTNLEAQEEPDIRSLLNLVRTGNEQLLEKKLPQLLEQYPNHPGLLFVQASLTTDADQAVSYYQTISTEFPKSEWADDALFKLYQYYYAIGGYNVASQQLAELKKRFPNSPFVKQATDASTDEKHPEQTFLYSVQAGAFSTLASAQVQQREIKKLGYTAQAHAKMKDLRKMYVVWVGEFTDFDQALAFAKKIKQRHGIDAVVVRR